MLKENIVTVEASTKTYPIIIESGLIDKVGEQLKTLIKSKTALIITEDTVDFLYGKTVFDSLIKEGFNTYKFVFKHGEKSKNLKVYSRALSFAAKSGLSRNDVIIALGGGVVGDLAGFVAATYLRGVKYVQIPTTLLSQIDSSVGGKTAVDLPEGKNLVGAFCQPEAVLIDPKTLDTLPPAVLKDGYGEAVKYAFLDRAIFDLMQEKYDTGKLIELCVRYKAKIVKADEFETGVRKLLNFGHTVAHGIEKISKYKIPHGRAVALGIKCAVLGGIKRGVFKKEEGKTLLQFVEDFTDSGKLPFDINAVLKEAVYDKKRFDNKITIACIYGIGDVREETIDLDRLGEYFIEGDILSI